MSMSNVGIMGFIGHNDPMCAIASAYIGGQPKALELQRVKAVWDNNPVCDHGAKELGPLGLQCGIIMRTSEVPPQGWYTRLRAGLKKSIRNIKPHPANHLGNGILHQ
ncbi:predicted protein [Histoplasma capsulatum H143]|uniref:Uncharacterized protein n=1 Tax=Ajellomyces capsulatus (strain H143) TaxID=544712 RepID=C6H1Z9_AJECH|nr:predicted protein [Histoplasma capsulatum H143]